MVNKLNKKLSLKYHIGRDLCKNKCKRQSEENCNALEKVSQRDWTLIMTANQKRLEIMPFDN